MALLRGFGEAARYRGGYVAIGNFDGVHRGHQSIVARLVQLARAAGIPAVVLTFDPHPVQLLRPEHVPPNLTTLELKADLLADYGVDCVIAYPTDRALLALSPEEFFQRIILAELAAKGLVEGPNFSFGRNRGGNIDVLRSLCNSAGVSLDVVEPLSADGRIVSSSTIRTLLTDGQLDAAVELLGHPYRIIGHVGRGAMRGRQLGFPTANLDEIPTLIPANGVYAGTARVGDREYRTAVHIGPNPTFGEAARKVETHLLDFAGDLYGQTLTVDLRHRLRGVQKFSSADELQRQLRHDIARTRELVPLRSPP